MSNDGSAGEVMQDVSTRPFLFMMQLKSLAHITGLVSRKLRSPRCLEMHFQCFILPLLEIHGSNNQE